MKTFFELKQDEKPLKVSFVDGAPTISKVPYVISKSKKYFDMWVFESGKHSAYIDGKATKISMRDGVWFFSDKSALRQQLKDDAGKIKTDLEQLINVCRTVECQKANMRKHLANNKALFRLLSTIK